MKKKAQAAMEFIMSYGWAILVVAAAFAALSYFGVWNQSKFVPEICELKRGFGCEDLSSTALGVSLYVRNGAGFDAHNVTLRAVRGCNDTAAGPQILVDNQAAKYTLNCEVKDMKIDVELILEYTRDDSSLLHTSTGSLITKVPNPLVMESPENETQVTLAHVYREPAYTFLADETTALTQLDAKETKISQNNEIIHAQFDHALSDGDVIKIFVTPCQQDGIIQIQEEGLGAVVASASCNARENQWLTFVLSGVTSASTTWDINPVGANVDFNYISYVNS